MSRLPTLAVAIAAALAGPCYGAEAQADPRVEAPPLIQVAILLDTSNSMDGLINQTREQLWRIVNTFASAKRRGQRARLELALYEYGNTRLAASDRWIRQVVPLTTDLDRVSEALFGLRTSGGDEYCGAVIERAAHDLAWSARPSDLKLIYIAGNEPFTQGPVRFQDAVKQAIGRGIVVNTIHAGTEAEGVEGQWAAAARLGDGNYLFIDQNKAVARVDAPQDAELARLSQSLNGTYVAYGAQGREAAARQVAQDGNAASLSPASVSTRAMAKSKAVYSNEGWDLVDARAKDAKRPGTLAAADLPVEMRGMSPSEQDAYLERKAAERKALQGQIARLAAEREAYVQAELKKRAATAGKTLDDALLESARAQATARSYEF
jgi:von Willebrand factor type A domain